MRRYIPAVLFLCFTIFGPEHLFAQADSTYELDNLNFKGNENFSSSVLSDQIISQETPWWFWKFLNSIYGGIGKERVYFDSLNIQDDIERLTSFYSRNGYLETEVSADYELDSADESASLTYTINEGPPFYINQQRIRGIQDVPQEVQEEIAQQTHIDSGKIYTQSSVEESQSKIISILHNRGYMLASISTPTNLVVDTITYGKNFIDINTRVNLGRRYRLGEITVNKEGPGADLVDSEMIKDIAGLNEGEYYSLERLRRAQSRLSRTNLFSSVFVDPTDTSRNTVPLEINGDIGLMNEAAPEFLMNNEENGFNVGIGLSYTRKNFFGQARKFTISSSVVARDILNIDYGNFFQSLSLQDTTLLGLAELRLTFEQPYLFSRQIYGTWDSYIKLNKQAEYNATIYGTRLSADIETPLYTYFSSLVTYVSYESAIYVYNQNYITQSILSILNKFGAEYDPEEVINYYKNSNNRKKIDNTSYLGVEAAANKTDDFIFPTRGHSLYLILEEGNSLSYLYNKLASNNIDFPLFYKVMANAGLYIDAYHSKVSTLAFKLKSGYIQAYRGETQNTPLNRRFYAGGSNSVRGWPSRGLSPNESNITSLSALGNEDLIAVFNNTATAIGGTFLFEGSAETRNRLFGDFGGALFLDFGNTWNGYKSMRVDEIAVATGFGFRYYTPVGPIRMDFGFKTYDPDDKRWIFKKPFFKQLQFHIAIGEAF